MFRTIKGFLEKPGAVHLANIWMPAPYKCQNLKFSTVTKFPITELWEKGREPLSWLPSRRSTPNVIKGISTFPNKRKMEAAINYKYTGGKANLFCPRDPSTHWNS